MEPSLKPKKSSIEYKVGKLNDKRIGIAETSLTSSINSGVSFDASVIEYDQEHQALRDLSRIKSLRSGLFLDAFFVDKDKEKDTSFLVVERFDQPLSTWVGNEYSQWKKDRTCSWFRHIEQNIRDIFRDVSRGLIMLYDRGWFHGDLFDSVVIETQTKITRKRNYYGKEEPVEHKQVHAKLLMVSNQEDCSFSSRAASLDLKSLWKLIVGVIGYCFDTRSLLSSDFDHDDLHFKKLSTTTREPTLSKDFEFFLSELKETNFSYKFSEQFIWVLDDPTFWTSKKRELFMRKTYDLSKRNTFLRSMDSLQLSATDYFKDFSSLMDKSNQRFKSVREHSGGGGGGGGGGGRGRGRVSGGVGGGGERVRMKLSRGISEVSRLCRNTSEHYNDTLAYKISNEKLSNLVNEQLEYPCAEVKNCFTHMFCREDNTYLFNFRYEIKYLLSFEPF